MGNTVAVASFVGSAGEYTGSSSSSHGVYIPLAEEPGLARRFGYEYLAYQRNVPRWIPRVRPWTGRESAPPDEKWQRLIDKS